MIGPYITAGRTTIGTLLIVAVLTAATVGTAGTVATDVIDGKGNDVLDRAGTDAVTFAFPINNATSVGGRTLSVEQMPSETAAHSDAPSVPGDFFAALLWSQDMDPY